MKTITVFEARNHFARTLEAAKDDVIIVTRNGRPVAAIQGIADTQGIDDGDVEDLLLERSERFWTMIARARRGKPIAIETLRKQCRTTAFRRAHDGLADAPPRALTVNGRNVDYS
jgi:prevent-host-death family protein